MPNAKASKAKPTTMLSRNKRPRNAATIPRLRIMPSSVVTSLLSPFGDPVFFGLVVGLLTAVGTYFAASGRWVRTRAALTAIGCFVALVLLYGGEYLYEHHIIESDFSATLASGRDWIVDRTGTSILAVGATVLGAFWFTVFVTGTDVDDIRRWAWGAGIASAVLFALDFILPFLAQFLP
jgi:hypothetical protein